MNRILLLAFISLATFSAYSDESKNGFKPNTNGESIILKCEVPTQDRSGPKIYITLDNDQSLDYTRIYLVDISINKIFFYQFNKNRLIPKLESGTLEFSALDENNEWDNGVLKNSGYFLIHKTRGEDSFTGNLFTQNTYPIVCLLNDSKLNIQNTKAWDKKIEDLNNQLVAPIEAH